MGLVDTIYHDIETEADLGGIGGMKVGGVHAIAFSGNKLVIVYSKDKGYWSLPGGGVEPNESPEDAIDREMQEETNMKIIKKQLIGFQDIYFGEKILTQARYVAIVEPYGPFVTDPGGDVTEIKLIDPKDIKEYFDWGPIMDHMLEKALKNDKKIIYGRIVYQSIRI